LDLGDDALSVGLEDMHEALKLAEDRLDRVAGAAPLSPEIQQNWLFGLENVLCECSVCNVHDVRAAHAIQPPSDAGA
jgi:hypothetical protein